MRSSLLRPLRCPGSSSQEATSSHKLSYCNRYLACDHTTLRAQSVDKVLLCERQTGCRRRITQHSICSDLVRLWVDCCVSAAHDMSSFGANAPIIFGIESFSFMSFLPISRHRLTGSTILRRPYFSLTPSSVSHIAQPGTYRFEWPLG